MTEQLTAARQAGQKSYLGAESMLNGRDRKKCHGVDTYLHRIDDDTIALHYKWTDVLTFHRDGRMIAKTGGWWTVTTKERMNRQGAAGVRQHKGEWYVVNRNHLTDDGHLDWSAEVPFVDGMDLTDF